MATERPVQKNLAVRQSERIERSWKLVDDSLQPHNLTDATVFAQVRLAPGLTKILDLGAEIDTDPLTGIVTIGADIAADLEPRKYYWDMIVSFGGTLPLVVMGGEFVVKGTITDPTDT